jgi:holliday junction DNA helicase RuvA
VIGSLTGVLGGRAGESVLVDVNGVGYLVTVGARTAARLPGRGESVRLFTYTYVREDALALFGFLTQEELGFFKLLLSVKGIGPKAGLAILGQAELRVLTRAVLSQDAAMLSTVPGIGPKTAARVVLELKGKLKEELYSEELRPALHAGDAVTRAIEIVTGLGYTPAEAKDAVGRVSEGNGGGHSIEQLVTAALKGLDRG